MFSYSPFGILLHLVMFTCQLQIRPRTSHCLTSCSCSPSMISSRSASLLMRAPTRLNLSRSSRCFLSSGNTFSKSSRFFASFPFLFADDSICKIIYNLIHCKPASQQNLVASKNLCFCYLNLQARCFPVS